MWLIIGLIVAVIIAIIVGVVYSYSQGATSASNAASSTASTPAATPVATPVASPVTMLTHSVVDKALTPRERRSSSRLRVRNNIQFDHILTNIQFDHISYLLSRFFHHCVLHSSLVRFLHGWIYTTVSTGDIKFDRRNTIERTFQ